MNLIGVCGSKADRIKLSITFDFCYVKFLGSNGPVVQFSSGPVKPCSELIDIYTMSLEISSKVNYFLFALQ